MSVMKALFLSVTLLFLAVGTVGCATSQPFGISSLHAPQLSFDGNQTAKKSTTTRRQPVIANAANESPIQVQQSQAVTTPTDQHAQAAYNQTLHLASYMPAPAALVTLGPNDNFRDILNNASGVVLVDFYADWCGPCRKQGGILHDMEQAASQHQATIVKVNIDQHRQLANEFSVSSLPTLMLIKNGQIVERQTGVASHQRVAALLAK